MNKEDKLNEIIKVQEGMYAVHAERSELAKTLMADLGTGDNFEGINLDNLTAFARKVMNLNRELEKLSKTHKELMGY